MRAFTGLKCGEDALPASFREASALPAFMPPTAKLAGFFKRDPCKIDPNP
jgi:hypothetical protein